MADTWFKATTPPDDVKWMFDNSLLTVHTNGRGQRYIHFELHQKDGYVGWVFLFEDGKVEFGEPAA